MEAVFGRFFENKDLYHNAVGIRDKTSGASYTIEYDAVDEIANATIPFVVHHDNATRELLWLNGGTVALYFCLIGSSMC